MSKFYRYTCGGSYLTKEQRDFYEENGYIVIQNLVDHDLLDELCQRFIDVCNRRVNSLVMIIAKDTSLMKKGVSGEFSVNKIQDFVYDDVFFKYCDNKNVIKVVEDIIGPDIVAVHTMLINKPPDASIETSLHPLHQDMHYFPFRPAEKIVASWTAMEKVDRNNGCLYVVPGSHKGTLQPHDYAEFQNVKNKLYHGVKGFENAKKVYLSMEKGDTVFFHPILLHGSGPNRTKGFRKAITCHYASGGCHFIDVRGTSQDNVRREIEEVVAKWGGSMSFEDTWRFKSRVVKGHGGEFSFASRL